MIKYFLPLFLAFSLLEAKVIVTANVADVLQHIDEETWFLVDLDNCMFEAAQALGHANWFYDEMQQHIQNGMSREEAIAKAYPGWIKTQKVCRIKPLEENFVPLLQELQAKGFTIMGLTHRQPSVADSTINQVASLGFNFHETAPSKEEFCVRAAMPTIYSQGILFVSDYNKKIDVFMNYLSAINKTPKKIVFIDDKRKNVDELEDLQKYGIQYVGIHYTAIENSKIYSREVAEFQLKFLDQIMSNEAALLLMERGLD